MKQCPACKTTYTDDSLAFCLEDGRPLVDIEEEEPTVVRIGDRKRKREAVPPAALLGSKPATSEAGSSTAWLKITAAVIILSVVGLAAIGLAGAAIYYSTGWTDPVPLPRTPTPRPTVTATPDAEKERLKDEIANIQRRLDEQKKNQDLPVSDDDHSSTVTGTVNSPNDGFLALRNIPDADRGTRLVKIPHGAEVDILNCEKTAVTISGRRGRWCQVEYYGQIGWVFDAWLKY